MNIKCKCGKYPIGICCNKHLCQECFNKHYNNKHDKALKRNYRKGWGGQLTLGEQFYRLLSRKQGLTHNFYSEVKSEL